MIRVGRYKRNIEGTNVYIGRGSPLGNPFKMDGRSRDQVVDDYAVYFHEQVAVDGALRDEVIRLFKLAKSGENLNLQCFCSPKRCHGDVVAAFLESHL